MKMLRLLKMSNSSTPLSPQSVASHDEQSDDLGSENWLSFHRVWGKLSDETIAAIAQNLHVLPISANQLIYQEKQIPQGIYFLKWGTVEIYRHSPVGKNHIMYRHAGDVLGYFPLVSNQLDSTYQANAVALTQSDVWFLHRDDTADELNKRQIFPGGRDLTPARSRSLNAIYIDGIQTLASVLGVVNHYEFTSSVHPPPTASDPKKRSPSLSPR
jgi:hypothetical protein